MLPMLSIPEKKAKSVDLHGPLRSDIARKWSKRKGSKRKSSKRKSSKRRTQDNEDDIQFLNHRRSQIANPPKPREKSSIAARLSLLQSWFHAICLVGTLFSSPRDQINNLAFTWYDAFKQNEKASQKKIHLEKAAVLFNLGALYSQIGQIKDRSTMEERREAAKAFCLAAGAFVYLKNNVAPKASRGESITVDVSVECARMLEKLMLAQAQECCFEIAVAKKTSPGACASISQQVALYYSQALADLKVAPLKGHVGQYWKSYLQLKADLFSAEACYRHGLKLHQGDPDAEEIALLQHGISILSKAEDWRKRGLCLSPTKKRKIKDILVAIRRLKGEMTTSLRKAENPIVYPRVPSLGSLESITPSSIVNPQTLDEVLGANNEKLFASIVRKSSATARSRYAKEVGGFFQTQKDKLKQCSEFIHASLEEMDLPDSIQAHPTLPAGLQEDVEKVQINGGLAGLKSELQQLGQMNQKLKVQIKEAREEAQSRGHSGTRGTRPQSRTLTKLDKINNNLEQAAEKDAQNEHLVDFYSTLMSILGYQPIESSLPINPLDGNKKAIALKKSLQQLKSLGARGKQLQQKLEHIYRKSDIQLNWSASMGSEEDLIKKEISKYGCICKEIDQNIEARMQKLWRIQDKNNELSSFPKLEDYKASCQNQYKKIQAAIDKYQLIKEYIDQTKQFYLKSEKRVDKVKRRVANLGLTRDG